MANDPGTSHDVTTTRQPNGAWSSSCSCGASWTVKACASQADIGQLSQAHAAYRRPETKPD